MTHPNMEADKMLEVYIYDYLMKRKLTASARTFQVEAEVPTNRTAIDTPGGFLLEWWSIFWDMFIARFKCPSSPTCGPRNEMLMPKSHEQQQHQSAEQQQQLQQLQMQQLMLQKHIEQQTQKHREQTRFGCATGNETPSRESRGGMNTLTKSKTSLAGTNRKSRSGINAGQPLDQRNTPILSSGTFGDQHPRQGNPGCNLQYFSGMKDQRDQQLQVSHGPKNTLNPLTNLKSAFSDETLTQLSGSSHGMSNFPLKGWPLMNNQGFERLQPGLVQQQSPLLHPSQPTQQLQLQQQLQMLLGDQYMDVRKDTQPHFLTNMVPDANLAVQAGLPLFSRADDTLNKLYQLELTNANQSQQQCQRPTVLSQCPETSSYKSAQQDTVIAATSNNAMDATFSNTSSRDNDQNLALRKRKQPMCSHPTNSSGTANTTIGPSQSAAPSSPSTQTMEDVISVPSLLPDDSNSRKICSSGADTNADIFRFINHGSVDDNVESFLNENVDTEDVIAQCLDASKDITFSEIGSIESNAVNCCDFSSEGKLIATGGDDNKVVLWCTDSREQKYILEEHSDKITDIRFSPRLARLASCSVDRMIKIWDVHNPGQSIRTFTGHSASVISIDFHPNKEDLICSCDDVTAIRYWTIKNGGCVGVSKVAAAQVRFQPTRGRFLAAAVGNGVSLIDVETTQTCKYPLMGHASSVQSVCWSASGEYLASLSEDLVRVWKVGSGGDQKCVHELTKTGKRFSTCSFHPTHPSLLVIGSYQSMELWNMVENKTMTVLEEPISTLAMSTFTGLVASVSGGNTVKLWK